jgi:hypothetical protein
MLPIREGAEPYQTRELDSIAYIVIHHTQAGPGRPTVLQVAEWQTGPDAQASFPSIAYHRYVEANGTIKITQDLEVVTWHSGQKGDEAIAGVSIKNWRGAAVCFSGDEPTPAQIVSIREECHRIDEAVGAILPRLGHKDLSSTECPGRTWDTWRLDI